MADLQGFLAYSALLVFAISFPVVNGQSDSTGVFLSLNGVTIPNDGYVVASDIGLGDSGLHCNTDRSDCCHASDHPSLVAQGHWYYPDGREVRDYTTENALNPGGSYFTRDRDTGKVRLNRNRNPLERGRFRCEVPNATGVNVTLYVNIVDVIPTTQEASTTQYTTTEVARTTQDTTHPPTTTDITTETTTADTTTQFQAIDTTTQAATVTTIDTTNPLSEMPDTTTQEATMAQTAITQPTTQTTHRPTSTAPEATTQMKDQSTTTPVTTIIQIQVGFQFISKENSFSLSCNSTGGQDISVVWTRDGFLLHNTGPLVLTDASTHSYTNVLMVSDRTPGTYTCTIRGPSDQVLSSTSIDVQASAPPLNIQATQLSSSGPVEVSWSPPSNGANIITGYRVYYGNGQSLLVPSYYVTSIIIPDNPPDVGETVSIHSESTQLPSELVNVTVMSAGDKLSSVVLCTCFNEVGISVSVLILVELIIALVIAIIVVLIWRRRKKSTSKNIDVTVIANMAYGQVNLGIDRDAGQGDLEYENPERLAKSGQDEPDRYELSGQWQYESIPATRLHPVSK